MPFRSTDINTNLLKGSARTGEVLQLLDYWYDSREDPKDFQQRAVEENLLGKDSRKRAGDFVRNVFGRRYFPDGSDRPARDLARLYHSELPRSALDLLLYYHAALAEHLLYLIATELIYEALRDGRQYVGTSDVIQYIQELEQDGRTPQPYSYSAQERIGQAALTALRDYGLLEGRAKKRISAVHIPHQVVGYVAYALRDEGHSAKRIVEHRDWKLFLLSVRAVERACIDAAQFGHFVYHAAGSVRRFDWRYQSLEEYVDAFVGS